VQDAAGYGAGDEVGLAGEQGPVVRVGHETHLDDHGGRVAVYLVLTGAVVERIVTAHVRRDVRVPRQPGRAPVIGDERIPEPP
jgi:(2Fe-2S) ferredoxin